jgi:thioredoxin reductase (NADPH)
VNPELVIVGAGPAGVSAALWARSLGLSALLLEAGSEPGGQLHHVYFRPENLPGAVAGHGAEIAAALAADLVTYDVPVRYDARAEALEPGVPAVRIAGGERFAANAVLIATGARRRRLEVPGERELEGRGVSFSANRDREGFAGEDMAVIGGGDSAYENALLLAAVGCRVTIVARGTTRARAEYLKRVAADPRIEVVQNSRVIAVLGEERVRAVRLAGPRGEFELPVSGVVVKVGVVPNTEWCAGALERDAEGFIPVDEEFGTSQPRVWAVGDVTRPAVAGIAVALGHGGLAVTTIRAVLRRDRAS